MHFELLIEYTYYSCTRTAVFSIIKNYKQFIFHSIRNIILANTNNEICMVWPYHLNQITYLYFHVSWQYIYQYMRHWTDFYYLQQFQKNDASSRISNACDFRNNQYSVTADTNYFYILLKSGRSSDHSVSR